MAKMASRPAMTSLPLRLATALVRLDGMRRTRAQAALLRAADQRLMWLLSDGEPRTLREIAEALGLEQSTVNRQVHAALDEELVHRTREPGRSAQVVTATDEGLSRFAHDLDLHLGAYRAGLAALPKREQAQLVDLLDRFVAGYETALQESVRST